MQFRIGDRDPVTGLYGVIWPDGSTTRNGLKIFNAAHQTGDVVLADQRSDGMIVLDSVKAVKNQNRLVVTSNPQEPPVGYLQGQVFNREEPVKIRRQAFLVTQGTLLDINFGNITIEEAAVRAINIVVPANTRGTVIFYVVYYSTSEVISLTLRPRITLSLSPNVLPALPVQQELNEYLWAIGNQIDRLGFIVPIEAPAVPDPVNILSGKMSSPATVDYPKFLFVPIAVQAERFPEFNTFVGTMTIQLVEFEGFELANNFAEIIFE